MAPRRLCSRYPSTRAALGYPVLGIPCWDSKQPLFSELQMYALQPGHVHMHACASSSRRTCCSMTRLTFATFRLQLESGCDSRTASSWIRWEPELVFLCCMWVSVVGCAAVSRARAGWARVRVTALLIMHSWYCTVVSGSYSTSRLSGRPSRVHGDPCTTPRVCWVVSWTHPSVFPAQSGLPPRIQ